MVGGKRRCPERSVATVKLLPMAGREYLFLALALRSEPELRRGRVWGGFGRGGRDDARVARQYFNSFGVVIMSSSISFLISVVVSHDAVVVREESRFVVSCWSEIFDSDVRCAVLFRFVDRGDFD